jgi:hypothetical protein
MELKELETLTYDQIIERLPTMEILTYKQKIEK